MKRIKLISALFLALSLCLVGCASTAVAGDEQVTAEASYSLVGYDFLFQLKGKSVDVKFIDIYSEEEIDSIATSLMASLPRAVDYSYSGSGSITLNNSSALKPAEFESFVEGAKATIYDLFY